MEILRRKPQRNLNPVIPTVLQDNRNFDENDSLDLSAQEETIWGELEIDYTAANQYIQAHYKDKAPSNPYFQSCYKPSNNNTITEEEKGNYHKVVEPIYNARKGILSKETKLYNREVATLDSCGFTLIDAPKHETIQNWYDIDEIRNKYLPKLETMIRKDLYNSDTSHQSRIQNIIFWNPMLRGEKISTSSRTENNQNDCDDNKHDLSTTTGNTMSASSESTIPTSPIASMVHIDTDVGAYQTHEEILKIIAANEVVVPATRTNKCSTSDLFEQIGKGHRFAILNIWRNVLPIPVQSAPLALLHTTYSNDNDHYLRLKAFPYLSPDSIESKWYTFPEMTRDECLFFLQYDRLVSQPSDVWHCALNSQREENIEESTMRQSFDIRALIIF